MKTAIITLATITTIVWLVLGIGLIQQMLQGKVTDGCQQFTTNTMYAGYHCRGEDVYVRLPEN